MGCDILSKNLKDLQIWQACILLSLYSLLLELVPTGDFRNSNLYYFPIFVMIRIRDFVKHYPTQSIRINSLDIPYHGIMSIV